jgi:hypothetical protein
MYLLSHQNVAGGVLTPFCTNVQVCVYVRNPNCYHNPCNKENEKSKKQKTGKIRERIRQRRNLERYKTQKTEKEKNKKY